MQVKYRSIPVFISLDTLLFEKQNEQTLKSPQLLPNTLSQLSAIRSDCGGTSKIKKKKKNV